jgi:hypothetical protein
VSSCRYYKREIARLDLEILHYMCDNTGPDSRLSQLFTHISSYYGNQDIFVQMMKDMPPVFHVNYAAQQTDRAQKVMEMASIHVWDLTTVLLPEVATISNKKSVDVKVGPNDNVAPKGRQSD